MEMKPALHQRERLDKLGASQVKLIFSIESLTKKIIETLQSDSDVVSFYLEQREKLIEALKLSETLIGPIGAVHHQTIATQQKELERLILEKIDESRLELQRHNEKTKDLKKYNLRNVR